MTDVKHMKWWGWGVEGVAFEHEDKPGFAPFILENLALDLHTAEQRRRCPSFDAVTVAKSLATPAFTKSLSDIVGVSNVTTDKMERVVHAYGKSLRDLVRIRANQIERTPDVVVYPDNRVRDPADRRHRGRARTRSSSRSAAEATSAEASSRSAPRSASSSRSTWDA